MKVRSTTATLEIEDSHGMGCIVSKYEAALSVCDKQSVNICLRFFRSMIITAEIIVIKDRLQIRLFAIDNDPAGREVDRSGHSTMASAEVNDQFIVNIEPEVVVSCELVDNIVAPVIQSAWGLDKGSSQFHSELEVWMIHKIESFVLSRIAVRKTSRNSIVEFGIHVV